MRIKHSLTSFILLMLLNIIIVFLVITCYGTQNKYDTETILNYAEGNFTYVLDSLFFNIRSAEVLVEAGLDDFSEEDLNTLVSPILENPGVINISFLPNGVVERVYPIEGNEKAIGDNVFEMPNRRAEAMIALETKEPILSGPYELTQGGVGLIMRQAVFLKNEQGEETFWGLVAVVLDAETVLKNIQLASIEQLGFYYELSNDINGQGEKVIVKSDKFSGRNAMYRTFELSNGSWHLGISKAFDIWQVVKILLIFSFGTFLALSRWQVLRKKENEIEEIRYSALTDYLTGLYNRKQLNAIEEQLAENPTPYTVFYIDLNDFKLINDTYGHEVGDEFLVFVANGFKRIIRGSDIAIRIGGDEFVILLANVSDEATVHSFCERLEALQKEKIVFEEGELFPSFSYGHAAFPADGKSLKEVLQRADDNMYSYKKQHKNKK